MGTREIMTAFRRIHSRPLGLKKKLEERDATPKTNGSATCAMPIGTVVVRGRLNHDFILKRIKEKGFNRNTAAMAMGISPSAVWRICRGGVAVPKSDTMQKIAAFLGVQVTDLYVKGK